jgi:hypothetical protein
MTHIQAVYLKRKDINKKNLEEVLRGNDDVLVLRGGSKEERTQIAQGALYKIGMAINQGRCERELALMILKGRSLG